MIVAVACDHAGFLLKEAVIEAVQAASCKPLDVGTFSAERVDYPDYAEKVGRLIQSGQAERGVLICGSGAGICIAANKMTGVYASVCHDTYSAHQGVEHDNMNVLCLGARVIGPELSKEIVEAFLEARFMEDERYIRRFKKTRALEEKE